MRKNKSVGGKFQQNVSFSDAGVSDNQKLGHNVMLGHNVISSTGKKVYLLKSS